MTEQGLAEVLSVLSESYHVDFKQETIRVWRLLLADIGDHEAREAVVEVCRRYAKLPAPAVLHKSVEWHREDRVHKLRVLEAREREKAAIAVLPETVDPLVCKQAEAAKTEIQRLVAGWKEPVGHWLRGADGTWRKEETNTALARQSDAV